MSTARRIFDIAGALAGLFVFAPVMAVITVAILIDDGRPVLFRQERLGYRRRPFAILKFRSMRDDRVTRVGRLLRVTGLDEVPQFINILRGEMSAVGPRPLTRGDVVRLGWDGAAFDFRWSCKPGLTGVAQLVGAEGNRLSLDLDRIHTRAWNPMLDCQLIAWSFAVNAFGKERVRRRLRRRYPNRFEPRPSKPSRMIAEFVRDVRYAIRILRRAPTFTATIVATLALGIGANSLIFSAVDAVLLRGAPVADPNRLVSVYTTSGNNPYSNSSYPDYFDLRDSGTFAALAAYTPIGMTIDAGGQPEPLACELVSGNYFEVLGVTIPVGRPFTPDDDRIGAPVRVAVVSHALWQRTFDGNRSSIGQTIRLNGNPYTLIGVAPPGFTGPVVGIATDVWVPTALQPEVDPPAAAVRRARGHSAIFDLRRSRGLRLIGRLPNDATVAQVSARADVIARRLEAVHPETNRNRRFTLTPLGEGRSLRSETRPVLRQLSGAVAMVLLVACVNVASLLLGRAMSRQREVAIRIAIGAGRGRLIGSGSPNPCCSGPPARSARCSSFTSERRCSTGS